MKTEANIRRLTTAALCVALCVVLPMAFHAVNLGSVFSPMHIPVLICGLAAGPLYGLVCGIAGPFLSSVLTGMPGMGYLPVMLVELAAYGLLCGLLMKLVKTGKIVADLYISLAISMLLGRVIAGAFRALLWTPGEYAMQAWVSGYFVSALPGIALHLILVPLIVFALMRAQLVPAGYQTAGT